jgi:ABC-type bacteriocin/lantibiotic exporter with double-glycine peptidase domain
VGYVPQRPRLFSGTILSNLRIGCSEAPASQVFAAAVLAGIHAEVLALPCGYETQVGEGGLKLSEGQKQRLALTQALVADPDILILDEPTTALDEAAEQSVLEALKKWRKGRTVIIVTHRASTARLCDRVVAIGEGRVPKIGLPKESSESANLNEFAATA